MYTIKSNLGYWNIPAQYWKKINTYTLYNNLDFIKDIYDFIKFDYEFENIQIIEINS